MWKVAVKEVGTFGWRMSESGSVEKWARRFATHIAVGLVVIHGGLLAWVSWGNSPNLDEPAHLASGITHWKTGGFDLYRVNPPFVRMVAAAPIILSGAENDWAGWNASSPCSRPEFKAGTYFVIENGSSAFWYFTVARWDCIPLCLVGGWFTFCWAKKLYGTAAGLTAMFLYCFCPNLVAWGASITPDAVGTSFGVMAAYTFWRWVRNPSWGRAVQAGLSLGLVELAKGTWIVLFVLWPVLGLIHRVAAPKRHRDADLSCETEPCPGTSNEQVTASSHPCLQFLAVLLIAGYLLNLGYGFEGSFKLLRQYTFISKTLSGQDRPPDGANRFSQSWLGLLPVPLPENYVRGLDVQKYDFEQGKWSYLRGEQQKGGWWYYYLYALLVKTPIGTLALFGVASVLAVTRRDFSAGWRNEFVLLLPAVAVLVLVSSQTGFNRYLRYMLPAVPFLYIHASRVAIAFSRRNRVLSVFVVLCLVGSAVESLSVFPHSTSFFNRLVGGPLGGPAHLVDANVDWGQDLLFLKRWYDKHPEARPFHVAYFGDMTISPKIAEIDFEPVPGFLSDKSGGEGENDGQLTGPQPGWFAVSVNHLRGYRHYESDLPKYTYFQHFKPVDYAGYSIYIYHITREEANSVRAQLGLPPLAE